MLFIEMISVLQKNVITVDFKNPYQKETQYRPTNRSSIFRAMPMITVVFRNPEVHLWLVILGKEM